MIQVQNLSKSFGSLQAVRSVSFEIQQGEIVGFLGPNGAGKSTTMKMITGFCVPDQGQVKIGEFDLLANPSKAKSLMGYLPESSALYVDMVVVEHLEYFAKLKGVPASQIKARIQKVCEQCGLFDVLDRTISELSKGFKQRVGLALALIHDPQVLILDEPTVGLDPNQIVEIRNLIQDVAQTKTVFISSHILSEIAATCHRVLILKSGQIVASGTPGELIGESAQQVSYKVRLKAKASQVQSSLDNLKDAVRFEVDVEQEQLVDGRLIFEKQNDQAESIFDWAVQNELKVLHLEKQTQSLENVFQNLTRE